MGLNITKKTREISGLTADNIRYADLVAGAEPVILRGAVSDWPLVRAGRTSVDAAMDYMRKYDAGRPVTTFVGSADIEGRFFYNDDVTGFNFRSAVVPFADFLANVCKALEDPSADSHYAGSTDLDRFFPGFRAENDLPLDDPMFNHGNLLASAWIGNKSITAAHYDMSHNMACCAVGKRRFTLFPPEAVSMLYPGPLSPTPGGQVITMVDFRNPDYDRFPKFKAALKLAQVAELEPGDMLYFPALWWHHVEGLDPFNIMINYWWNDVPLHIDDPRGALMHAMLALRDRPLQERQAWQHMFKYYAFDDAEETRAHIPQSAHGELGKTDAVLSRKIRTLIMRLLNR